MNPFFQYAIVKSILNHQGKCPRCGHRYLLKNLTVNTHIHCKKCGHRFKLPKRI